MLNNCGYLLMRCVYLLGSACFSNLGTRFCRTASILVPCWFSCNHRNCQKPGFIKILCHQKEYNVIWCVFVNCIKLVVCQCTTCKVCLRFPQTFEICTSMSLRTANIVAFFSDLFYVSNTHSLCVTFIKSIKVEHFKEVTMAWKHWAKSRARGTWAHS